MVGTSFPSCSVDFYDFPSMTKYYTIPNALYNFSCDPSIGYTISTTQTRTFITNSDENLSVMFYGKICKLLTPLKISMKSFELTIFEKFYN